MYDWMLHVPCHNCWAKQAHWAWSLPAVRPIVCLIRQMDLGVKIWLTLLSVPFESCSPLQMLCTGSQVGDGKCIGGQWTVASCNTVQYSMGVITLLYRIPTPTTITGTVIQKHKFWPCLSLLWRSGVLQRSSKKSYIYSTCLFCNTSMKHIIVTHPRCPSTCCSTVVIGTGVL